MYCEYEAAIAAVFLVIKLEKWIKGFLFSLFLLLPSKAQITSKFYKIPEIRFEDQQITSFSGLLIFQLFFTKINLKQQLKKCFSHLKVSPIFGRHLVVLLLIVHLLLGFRRLREIDYYLDDPIVLRLMGLRKLPDVSTIVCQSNTRVLISARLT